MRMKITGDEKGLLFMSVFWIVIGILLYLFLPEIVISWLF